MAEQLSLPVQLPDDETFESFVAGANTQLVGHLQSLTSRQPEQGRPFLTFIHGEKGLGKSHLLYSVCHQAQFQQASHLYLNFSQTAELDVGLLAGLEQIQLLCLDDIDCLAGDYDWQVAVFDLINRVREHAGCQLIIAANVAPAQLNLQLEDLRSRLAWGVTYQLKELTDSQRITALINRADRRGMGMSDEVARFLLSHMQRDMPSLMNALQELDNSSLKEKRRLTIPFVKHVLSI